MFETDNLLESVIRITKERNKRSLEYTLVEILAEYLDFEAAFLLNTATLAQDAQLEIAAYYCTSQTDATTYHRPRLMMPVDESIKICFDRQEIVCDQKGATSRCLFPIVVNGRSVGVLLIYSKQDNLASNKLILGFIRIYTNFLGILTDSERDTLTGLLNRKAFDTHLAELIADSRNAELQLDPSEERRNRTEHDCLWLGVLDIDHFKSVNDTFGHLYGDEVLMLFANMMQKSFRISDLLFRYGGEEFIVILAPTSAENAEMVFERFRKTLEEYEFPQVKRITTSIGIAPVEEHVHPYLVVEHADKALYFAKENGRNQIAQYQQLLVDGHIDVRKPKEDVEIF